MVERTENAIPRTQKLRGLHGVKQWTGKRKGSSQGLNAGKAGGSLPGTQGKSAGLRRIAERRGTAQYIVRGQFRPK